jgi:hypothetical protein
MEEKKELEIILFFVMIYFRNAKKTTLKLILYKCGPFCSSNPLKDYELA